MHTRPISVVIALLLAGRAVADEPPAPLVVADFVGPRTLALQAGVGGAASGTEALFLNPAAIAARKRYTVDALYLTDRRSGLPAGLSGQQDYAGGSVTDSSTTQVAAGFGYVRAFKGIETGTLLRLALAMPLTRGLYAGVQGNYFDLRGQERVPSSLNMDAGLLFQVTSKVSVGAVGYNLVGTSHRLMLPRSVAVGFAAGSETSFQVLGDWKIDLDRAKNADGSSKSTNRFGIGAEYLFDRVIPVRVGFAVDDTASWTAPGTGTKFSGTKWWSVGVGWVSTRAAVDVGYRQSTDDSSARTLEVAFKLFVPSE